MEQNTVIISTEEYNRRRDAHKKVKTVEEDTKKYWEDWYTTQKNGLKKQFEDNIKQLVEEKSMKVIYGGMLPNKYMSHELARHWYGVVPIDYNPTTVPEKKKPWWKL